MKTFEDLGPIEASGFEDLGPAHYKMPRESQVDPTVLDRFSALAKDFYTKTGEPLRVTDTFRTYEEQADLKRRKPTLAAEPGKSKHETGRALDIDQQQIGEFGLDNWSKLLDEHGFVRPALSKGETWHIELPRTEQLAEKTAAKTSQFVDLGPVEEPKFEDIGPIEPTLESTIFAPTKEQSEAQAKAAGVSIEPGLEQPVFLDPLNIVSGLGGIAKASGAKIAAKALPGMLAGEAAGGAAYSGLEGNQYVPEWARLPLALGTGVGAGLLSSKLGAMAKGATIKPAGIIPPDDVIMSELTAGLNKGRTAQEVLADMAKKYDTTVADLVGLGATPTINAGAQSAAAVPKFKSPLDSSELGAPVITRTITTKHDSTLGPAGTKVDTIPLNEGHVAMREAFQKRGVDIVAPKVMGWGNTFKTNERIFSELDDIAPGFHTEFWGKLKQSENIAHKDTQQVFKDVDNLASQYGKSTGEKIGIDLIAKRRSGLERLQAMGITPKPLTIQERQLANDFQGKFHDYLVRINEARALAGKQPIKEDPNYITFMSNFVNKVSEGANPIMANPNTFAVPTSTPFKFEKAMKGSKEAIETNLFTVYKNYAALAERHINLSPHLEKIRKFINPMELPNGDKIPALAVNAPNAATALANMAKVISGVKPPMTKLESILSKASDNLVLSTLGAYPRSVLNQTGALASGSAETGITNMMKGLTTLLKPGAYEYATKNSHVLAQRKMDVVLEKLGATWASSLKSKAQHYAMYPLEVADDLIARAIWYGGVKKGLGMGMSEEAAHRFADKIVIRTQASASPIDRAMVQSSTVGKLATAFQTFSIADANYIARNIFGKGNINFKTADGFKKLVKMSVVGTALNLMYRDVLGIPAGLPEPTHAIGKALDEGAGPVTAALEGAKEFSPFVPVLGSMAYGKVPFGALGGVAADLVAGNKSPAEALALLAGVPGMNMIVKGLKTQEGRQLLAEAEEVTGLPVGPRTRLTKPPATVGEILFGKDATPQRRKPSRLDELVERLVK